MRSKKRVMNWNQWFSLSAGCMLGVGLLFSSLVTSCAPSDEGTHACVEESLEKQPKKRFPSGSTYILPRLKSDRDCSGLTWKLEGAPDGNKNALVVGDDGYARFTPALAGTYSFKLSDGKKTVELGVVEGTKAPFHNYNYYPSRSIVVVNGEIWVANVYKPTLTRLSPSDLKKQGEVAVGQWPVALAWAKGMKYALVAHRASDTLGFVNVESKQIEDSVWVGDEPTNVVVSADGKKAYVALSTSGEVAIVDVEAKKVTGRIAVGADPLGMAIDEKGGRLFVAMHRTGHTVRFPFKDTVKSEEKDIAIIDIKAEKLSGFMIDIGTTITSLHFDQDSNKLWVATTRNDNKGTLGDEKVASFVHEVAAYEPKTGEVSPTLRADLTRQTSSKGHAVSVHGMTLCQGKLWVVAEGSNLAVALDPKTFEEVARHEAKGRPRRLTCHEDKVYVHGAQGMVVTQIAGGGETKELKTTEDPRPVQVAAGQAYFTGAGGTFAKNWSCNSCHLDGKTDTVVWNAGPFEDRVIPRPMFWLEGTYPLGWSGYLSDVRNYAYTVNSNVGRPIPNTDQILGLWAYIASLMPPPAANSFTMRDGSLSAEGKAGKALYEGKAACAGCHPAPLTTSRASLPNGYSKGVTDIPALVGSYRFNIWLKQGETRSLEDAVARMAQWQKVTLTQDEIKSIARYMQEMTGRHFFVLTSNPKDNDKTMPVGRPLTLTFSLPVFADAANLKAITLHTKDGDKVGEAIECSIEANGRLVSINPKQPLRPGAGYLIKVGEALESYRERKLYKATEVSFTTAKAPKFKFDGNYTWTIEMPAPDFANNRFDPSRTLPVSASFVAKSTVFGADVTMQYADTLTFKAPFIINDDELISGALPAPAGAGGFVESTGMRAKVEDKDGDKVIDSASGSMTISGPGFLVPGIKWTLAKAKPPGACDEGSKGDIPVEVKREGETTTISWGSDNSLGVYVTSPDAQVPFGPGQKVQGKATYWALSAEKFPAGFAGPVTYGKTPEGAKNDTEFHGGPKDGAPLKAGMCLKFTVITNKFAILEKTILWK